MTGRPDVLVVGGGVSGLSTALRLAERGVQVLLRAEAAPAYTTSAAAGAIWEPIYAKHPRLAVWATRSYDEFDRMAAAGFPGVRLVGGVEASREPMITPDWARDLPGYRDCRPGELPPGFVHGWHYTAPIIDMHRYLAALTELAGDAGARFEFGTRLAALADGFEHAPIVVNCTGIGARELVPDLLVAEGIVKRCGDVFPEIREATILGHRGGIRPNRPTIRLEHEQAGGGRHLVHNYGHNGAGVSLSWGCADDVTDIVLPLLS